MTTQVSPRFPVARARFLRQKAGQGAGVGRRALPRQQTIAVGQADGRGGVFYPSDRGIVVIDRGVLPPGQGVRLHAVGGQQGIKVHATQVVGVLVLDGDVKGACPSAAASMVRLRPMELAVMPIARSRRMQITVWDR